uniref:M15 family metallopeptidase n=1 Tax=Phenylobacterium glaciei TaxID=2803784 RepID=A0A974P499_9CAUL|nr:M15 family metallopeptidase [Phenylobacterium glaciei]
MAGTARRSMHAYGAAIDISTAQSDYWLWKGGEAPSGPTASRRRSSRSSSATASSGAAGGDISTPCTSSTGQSCYPERDSRKWPPVSAPIARPSLRRQASPQTRARSGVSSTR